MSFCMSVNCFTSRLTSIAEVNRLVKQFTDMQKLMKQLRGGRRIPGLFGR